MHFSHYYRYRSSYYEEYNEEKYRSKIMDIGIASTVYCSYSQIKSNNRHLSPRINPALGTIGEADSLF